MRVRQLWRQFVLKVGETGALKLVRRVLFEKSHLSPFLPIMREQLPEKLARIYGDKSYPGAEAEESHPAHQQQQPAKGRLLADFFLRSKECLNPLIGPLLFWYCLVFFSIITTYFSAGIALTYGT